MDDAEIKRDSEDKTRYPAAVEGVRPTPANKGDLSRSKMIEQGKIVTLISDLNCSLLKSGKLLSGFMDVRLSLTKNYAGYVLLEAEERTYKLKFVKYYLIVTMQQPGEFCLNLMKQKLLKAPAIYQQGHNIVAVFF